MKKVLLTIACVAFAFAANAQWVVSGNIGINANGGHSEYTGVLGATTTNYTTPATKTFGLNIVPSIGYRINDNMQAGLGIGFGYNKTTTFNPAVYALANDKEDWTSTGRANIKIAPYFRYYFAQAGKFSFFAEATLNFGFMTKGKTHYFDNTGLVQIDTTIAGNTKVFGLGFNIVPGINYQLNDNFSVDCYIDLLSLNYQMTKSTTFVDASTPSTTITTENIDVNNSFYFGVQALPQTIASHLGWFRLGLNYAF